MHEWISPGAGGWAGSVTNWVWGSVASDNVYNGFSNTIA